jgi:sec-independent protein translocase protein TatA
MFAWSISAPEAMTLLVLAVLLFGKKLPEVAASMGKSLRVFQNSWQGVENDVFDRVARAPVAPPAALPQQIGSPHPKIDESAAAAEPPPAV